MKAFRFRAHAALQLRRREHDQALVVLAQAQTALVLAERGVSEADQALRTADEQLTAALRQGRTDTPLEWYRSWKLRCAAARTRRERERQARETDLQAAAAAAHETHRRVRALERLQEHLLAAWRRAAAQEEQKTIDALAASRFVRRKDVP